MPSRIKNQRPNLSLHCTTRPLKVSLIIIGLLLLVNINHATALKLPGEYKTGECRIIADDFKEQYGGGLVNIYTEMYPVGHVLNKLKIGGGIYYIDYGYQRIFSNPKDIINWYINQTGFTDARLIDFEGDLS